MDVVAELKKEVEARDKVIATQSAQIAQLQQELAMALHRMFSRSSEKFQPQGPLLFDELEEQTSPSEPETPVEAKKPASKGRRPLAANLPRKHTYHDLPESERMCRCGRCMTKFGEDLAEKLSIIPAQVWVEAHHQAKYSCPDANCPYKGDGVEPGVTKAPGPLPLIPKSIVTAALVAHIWIAKFCDHLPFYRQEAGFARIGADISRQDMSRWTIRVSNDLEPLANLLVQAIREGPVINMDETPVTVLELEKTGTTGQGYMWLARGGTQEHPAVIYHFGSGRGSEHARAIVDNWEGWLQADGFKGYDTLAKATSIKLVGCWAHARRKFFEAHKAAPSALNSDALGRIKKLYALEDQCRQQARDQGQTDEQFVEVRRALLTPYLEELRAWLDERAAQTLPSGATGKALAYTVGQWDKLVRFLDHSWLTPDNNKAENAIRPFVVGRKNWLFHGNDASAQASCRIYSLIETAKLGGLEPWAYLNTVLDRLPEVRLSGDWESLLPWNICTGMV
jgi:transposase